jgi:multidrug resistance efflux pump
VFAYRSGLTIKAVRFNSTGKPETTARQNQKRRHSGGRTRISKFVLAEGRQMLERNRGPIGASEPLTHMRVITSDAAPQWAGLADATDEAKFCSAWLSAQCARITGVLGALLMMPPPARGLTVASTSWPARNPHVEDLMRLAERASAQCRAVSVQARRELDQLSTPTCGVMLALPLGPASEPVAVVAVALAWGSSTAQSPESVVEQLRWGAGWLEALPWAARSKGLARNSERAASLLDLLAVAGAQPRMQGMALAIVNDLVTRLRCDRVSMGLVRRNGSIRLRALSHSASFKGQGRLVDTIQNAMEEALDQRSSIAHPPLPTTSHAVAMAHQALAHSARAPGAVAMSVILTSGKGEPIGALTFERHRSEPFDEDALDLAQAIGTFVGPVVEMQLHTNRFVSGRVVDAVGDGSAALLGPRRISLKLAVAGLAGLALYLIFATAEHRITAKSVLEGELQRAAVAPFDGFIRSAAVRAGDTVTRGDLLVMLDDRDLVLDQLKWRAERDKLSQREREALAKHDRSNVVVLAAQLRQAESQLALAQEKLARARIVAPFDGIVVSGDLSQMLGSPVEKGKTLFELAPLDSYRLVIHVDERDVRYASLNQRGIVALAGMPGDPVPLIVTKIMPVNVAEEGRNSFRVEARLTEARSNLRPGMEGIAKIESGPASLMWIWTRSLIDWFRLMSWKHLP